MEFKLIVKKLNNTLSENEAIIFSNWYNESSLHRDYFDKVKDNYDKDGSLDIDLQNAWKSIEKQIKPIAKKNSNYTKYMIAASIVILFSVGHFVYRTTFDEAYITSKAIENIPSGFEKATLILDNGSEVNLGQAKNETISSSKISVIRNTSAGLVYNSIKVDSKLQEEIIKYNTLRVPVGGIYTVELSDGTKVWLNSESSLTFPINFSGKQRVVTLKGEAFFDVTESAKEFIVKTNNADVTVLGTEFNVSSYANDDELAITLVEGKVQMAGSKNSVILSPNQQGYLAVDDPTIEVRNVDVEIHTAWKEGKFYFKKEPLGELLKKMNRWYNVDVLFSDETIKNEIFTGVVLKNKPIDYLLNSISETTNLYYTINKNEVTDRYEVNIYRK